jgi:DNA-binding NarL/FixJ family response regulator
VGRDHELEEAVGALASGRGALLVGPAGVGRSRLARAASERAGGPVEWFHGASTAPFGPFARLLPGPSEVPVVERFPAAAAELAGRGPDVVAVVDDAHLLDDVSLAFVDHVLDATPVRLLLTTCADDPMPPSLARRRRDGLLAHVAVHPLHPDDVGDLVTAALPGEVDRALRRWLVETSDGNPLLLRELLADALEREAVTFEAGRWQRRGAAGPPTARLREVVGVRQGTLGDDERTAAELLAVGGQLPVGLLEALTSPAAVVGLERREMLVAGEDSQRVEVGLAHPVHAEVLLGELGPVQVRAHLRALVAAVEVTPAGRRQDRFRLALWRARLGEVDDWRLLLDVAREVAGRPHEEVARVATRAPHATPGPRVHLVTALELARAAEAHGGGFEAATLVRALCLRLGDAAGVAAADARLEDLAPAALAAVADDSPALEAAALAVGGRPADALGAAAAVLDDADATATDRVLATAARVGALVQLGRTAEAAAVAEGGLRQVHGAAAGPVWALVIAQLYALLIGGRLGDAEEVATACRDAAARAGSDDGVAAIEVALASTALAQGRPRSAVRWAEAAVDKLADAELRNAALGVLAHAAATRGDLAVATSALDRTDDPATTHAIGPQLLRARAWVAVAAGRVDDAIEGLRADAAACQGASAYVGELGFLHDVARLGRPDLVAERVAEVVAGMDDVLPPAVLAHVLALRDDDGAALEAAAAGFCRIGAAALEAEALAQAAGAHRRAGAASRSAAAAARARAVAARCEGSRTPGMAEADAVPVLTRREHQVAELAARGLTDRAVAEALGIAVRTAETHLHNAFTKLGVTRRADLGTALDTLA